MKRKLFHRFAVAIAVLSAIVLIATFPIESSYASRSRLVQRIKPSAESELFGDAGEKIGSPQELIVDDPSVFLTEPTPEGVAQVDENKLLEKKIYPLQLQTVRFVAGMTRMGAGVALVVGLLATYVLGRKRSNQP